MINVTKSSLPKFDEYCKEVQAIFDSFWLTNMGEKHQKLEKELKSFLNVNNITLYTNGHLALENAISVFDFPKGSEIITTPFTFVSTTHAIVRCGCVPVFCDINNVDYTIDVNKIEKLITDKTVAILPVHVYGNVCDVDTIERIAKKYNLKVIYDAAHAFGSKYLDKSVVNFGDISMLSFHATKVFNTIEGGALCYNNSSLVQKLNDMKNFGIRNAEEIAYIGGNAKMNEFCAAMGLCNLRYVDKWITERKIVYDTYVRRLDDVAGIKINKYSTNITPNYAYMPVLFDGYRKNRNEIFDELKKNNIIARKYFYPLTNNCEAYKDKPYADVTKTSVAKYISDNILTLPIYPDLSIDDVNRICDVILN